MAEEIEPKSADNNNDACLNSSCEQIQNLELILVSDDIPMLSDDGGKNFKRTLDVELDSTTKPAIIRSEIWRLVLVLSLGQLLSLCLAVAGFTSSYIAKLGVDMPLSQSFITYLALAVVYGSIFLHRRQQLLGFRKNASGILLVLQVPWYWYIILAVVDVQANYLYVKAYQYSSITSVTLLDCWTIPWVIILTWFILRTRYSLWQFFGAALCVVGLVLVLLLDAKVPGGGGRNPLLGDTLVIASTFCYALSNVGEEFCVKKKDQVEVVAMLGVFGVVVIVCEISIFERKDLASVEWSPTLIALFAGFAASSFLFYTVVPFLLKMSGSTLFNLSLLTSDMWAVLIRIFFYQQQVNWLYYLAFTVVAVGLIIYSFNDTTSDTAETTLDEEAKPLTEDSSTHE